MQTVYRVFTRGAMATTKLFSYKQSRRAGEKNYSTGDQYIEYGIGPKRPANAGPCCDGHKVRKGVCEEGRRRG